MKTPRAPKGSQGTSGRRLSESSASLSWLDVDRELEVRDRLAAIVDALDIDDAQTARINAAWLLDDLDGASA